MEAGQRICRISLLTFFILTICISTKVVAGDFPSLKVKKQQNDTLGYTIYRGKLLTKDNRQPLSFATIAVEGENTATVSNEEGEFILKISKASLAKNIVVSYLGYKNLVIPIKGLNTKKNVFYLQPSVITLNEIVVTPGTAEQIVLKVLANVSKNYSTEPNQMTGFYRESVKKRNAYVSLAEAIVNIYKAAYKGILNDQVQIIKGRKGENVKKMDTLLFKLQGGPTGIFLLDLIKNQELIFNAELPEKYNFQLNGEIMINGRVNFIITFQKKYTEDILYEGRLYVDAERYALTAADFQLNLDNPEGASDLFIRGKPANVKVTPVYTHYLVKYHTQDGKWYFNYAKEEVRFKVKWKKKLFSSNFTVSSEIAITDRSDQNIVRFKPRERFKPNQVFSETVTAFSQENYWGKYNYIEPDQSIEMALKKFKRLLGK